MPQCIGSFRRPRAGWLASSAALVLLALPASPAAAATNPACESLVTSLYWGIFWLAVVVVVVVQALLIGGVFRIQPVPQDAHLPRARISRRRDMLWTLLPALALAIVLALTLQSLRGAEASQPTNTTPSVAACFAQQPAPPQVADLLR
ncbi:MAG: hypothetical protein MUD01_11255 [Chloroflexaceae bacterium]|nr:hypothetical protein [Chloroflexaceae bacterium]